MQMSTTLEVKTIGSAEALLHHLEDLVDRGFDLSVMELVNHENHIYTAKLIENTHTDGSKTFDLELIE